MLADRGDHVVGIDPDRDRISAAVVCASNGAEIASQHFPTTARGYRAAVRWADGFSSPDRRAWSIEGTAVPWRA